MVSDYKTRLAGLVFGIFKTTENLILIPKKSTYFIIILKTKNSIAKEGFDDTFNGLGWAWYKMKRFIANQSIHMIYQ